ncbi:MAG: two-component system, chemotaxis family, CheB/CheR fusion protein [Acidobacteriota bacterium]|jgi:PAS domain S-box-containing protein|nr:two-component system, chemotaxis family, CheB/CheR fusion protein [Acidobacteriota bacterium]
MIDPNQLLDVVPQAIIATDPSGIITYWNGGAERLYGWKSEEVIGRRISEVTVPVPALARAGEIMENRCGRKDWSGAFRVRRRDGSEFVALVSNTALANENGETTSIVGVSAALEQFDVPQIRAESEAFYRDIVESAQEGIMMSDVNGRVMYANDRFAEMVGYSAEKTLGRHMLEFLPEEEHARINEKNARHGESISEQYELRMQRTDGTRFWVLIESRPMKDPAGNFRGTRATVIDITSRRESEERLRGRELQLREAQKVARIASWDLDLRKRVCHSEEGWGIDSASLLLPADVPLDEIIDLIHPSDRDRVLAALAETELTGRTFEVEYRICLYDGKYRIIHSRGELVRGDDGEPLRIAGVVQNITERKRLEDRLQQAERVSSIGRLASSVAHEFNNILMGIQPFAELISRRANGDETITNAATQIAGSVARGKRITQDILRFTRTPDPVLRSIDVASWLHRVEPDLRQLAGPRVSLAVHSDQLTMLADDEQLRQVLSNLVVNAADAMPLGGQLFIDASAEGKSAHIVVRDTGSGMSPETLAMIFEPLFTTKKSGGNGLGLAIAYQLMQRQDGNITAESEPGRGSTFHLRIPLSKETPAETKRTSGAYPIEMRWPFARITLVEDNESVADGLAAVLALDGVSVDIVPTGGEAVNRIEEHKPEAVVLDIGLPDISGLVVFDRISARWPNLPVLFSTGHGDEKLLGDRLERPNVAWLQKPYETDALLTEMRKLHKAMEDGAVRISSS